MDKEEDRTVTVYYRSRKELPKWARVILDEIYVRTIRSRTRFSQKNIKYALAYDLWQCNDCTRRFVMGRTTIYVDDVPFDGDVRFNSCPFCKSSSAQFVRGELELEGYLPDGIITSAGGGGKTEIGKGVAALHHIKRSAVHPAFLSPFKDTFIRLADMARELPDSGGIVAHNEYLVGMSRMFDHAKIIFIKLMTRRDSWPHYDWGYISEKVEKLKGDLSEYGKYIPEYDADFNYGTPVPVEEIKKVACAMYQAVSEIQTVMSKAEMFVFGTDFTRSQAAWEALMVMKSVQDSLCSRFPEEQLFRVSGPDLKFAVRGVSYHWKELVRTEGPSKNTAVHPAWLRSSENPPHGWNMESQRLLENRISMLLEQYSPSDLDPYEDGAYELVVETVADAATGVYMAKEASAWFDLELPENDLAENDWVWEDIEKAAGEVSDWINSHLKNLKIGGSVYFGFVEGCGDYSLMYRFDAKDHPEWAKKKRAAAVHPKFLSGRRGRYVLRAVWEGHEVFSFYSDSFSECMDAYDQARDVMWDRGDTSDGFIELLDEIGDDETELVEKFWPVEDIYAPFWYAKELVDYAMDDSLIYKNRVEYFIRNYAIKMYNGVFDEDLARKGLADNLAKDVSVAMNGGPVKMSRREKDSFGWLMLDRIMDDIETVAEDIKAGRRNKRGYPKTSAVHPEFLKMRGGPRQELVDRFDLVGDEEYIADLILAILKEEHFGIDDIFYIDTSEKRLEIAGQSFSWVDSFEQAKNIAIHQLSSKMLGSPGLYPELEKNHLIPDEVAIRSFFLDDESWDERKNDAEEQIKDLKDEIASLKEDRTIETDKDEIARIDDEIAEKEEELDDAISALDNIDDEQEEEIQNALDDPLEYFVKEQGIFDEKTFVEKGPVTVDYGSAAEEAVDENGPGRYLSSYDDELRELPGRPEVYWRTN